MQTSSDALIVARDIHSDVSNCFIVFIYYTHLYGSEQKCQVIFYYLHGTGSSLKGSQLLRWSRNSLLSNNLNVHHRVNKNLSLEAYENFFLWFSE
jgi:hypothetical protein